MKTHFNKGQKVTIVQNHGLSADNASGYIVKLVPALVYSAGKKRMVLTDLNGNKFAGIEFEPAVEQYDRYRYIVKSLVMPTEVNEDVIQVANKFGEDCRKRSIAYYVNGNMSDNPLLKALNNSGVTVEVAS
jgi:hypothetical protein